MAELEVPCLGGTSEWIRGGTLVNRWVTIALRSDVYTHGCPRLCDKDLQVPSILRARFLVWDKTIAEGAIFVAQGGAPYTKWLL